MKKTIDFLDAIKSRHKLTSDYQLAKLLQVQPSGIGHYRHGRSTLDDKVAVRVATLLDLDPGYVLACIHAERAKGTTERRAWEELAKKAAAAAICLIGVGFLALFGGTGDEPSMIAAAFSNLPVTHYATLGVTLAAVAAFLAMLRDPTPCRALRRDCRSI